MTLYKIYCDGACEPHNPGGIAAWGFVIYQEDKKIFENFGIACSGKGATNNVAEYKAIISALEYLVNNNLIDSQVEILSDSKLAINQLNGYWNITKPHLRHLVSEVHKLITPFQKVAFQWIPREKNTEADFLSKQVYRQNNIPIHY